MNEAKYKRIGEIVPILEGLEPADVKKILLHGPISRYEAGVSIVREGETGRDLYVILGGECGVFQAGLQLAVLKTGEFFGEIGLLLGEARIATVTTQTPAKIFRLNEAIFQRLLTKKMSIQILMNLNKALSRRLQGANAAVVRAGQI